MAEPHSADVAAPERCQQVLSPAHFEAFGKFGNVDLTQTQAPVLTLQHRPALGYIYFMILLLEPATYLRARRGRFQISKAGIQPVATRMAFPRRQRSEEHTSELQSLRHLVCRLLL